jgi:uncharacterized OsmC-like protein
VAGPPPHRPPEAGRPPVHLLDVAAAPRERTQVKGFLWDGVLNATPDDRNDGPTPIEALLAALGACVVRNLASTADSAHVVIDRVEIHVAADRSDDLPVITNVRLDIDVSSQAPRDRVIRVVELASSYRTITRTIARAAHLDTHVSINGEPKEVPHER